MNKRFNIDNEHCVAAAFNFANDFRRRSEFEVRERENQSVHGQGPFKMPSRNH